MINNFEGKTIIGIEEENGKKIVHFYGYGYYSEGAQDEKTPYRFVEYTFFYAPLEEVVEVGVSNYESEYSDQIKQYIMDCTRLGCEKIYETYDNGNPPILLNKEKLSIDTPKGVYILI